MEVLTKFIATMVAVSIAAERMVELIKGWWPNKWLFTTQPNQIEESRRCAWLQCLAGLCGLLVAIASKTDVFKMIGTGWSDQGNSLTHYLYWTGSYVIVGLLASGGSAFWNHALDLIKASKIKQEQAAIDAVAVNQQEGRIDSKHPSYFEMSLQLPKTVTPPETAPSTGAAIKTCVIQPDPASSGFLAKVGTIGLTLTQTTGSFNFDPLGCSVTLGATNVPLSQKTTNLVEFVATQPGLYTLNVQYVVTPGSTSQLKENCTTNLVLRYLDDTVAPNTIYKIKVS